MKNLKSQTKSDQLATLDFSALFKNSKWQSTMRPLKLPYLLNNTFLQHNLVVPTVQILCSPLRACPKREVL